MNARRRFLRFATAGCLFSYLVLPAFAQEAAFAPTSWQTSDGSLTAQSSARFYRDANATKFNTKLQIARFGDALDSLVRGYRIGDDCNTLIFGERASLERRDDAVFVIDTIDVQKWVCFRKNTPTVSGFPPRVESHDEVIGKTRISTVSTTSSCRLLFKIVEAALDPDSIEDCSVTMNTNPNFPTDLTSTDHRNIVVPRIRAILNKVLGDGGLKRVLPTQALEYQPTFTNVISIATDQGALVITVAGSIVDLDGSKLNVLSAAASAQ
jgi:hypothetical protein